MALLLAALGTAAVDVSEPVRTTLGQYMAGPHIQLVRLDACIPIQIEAEAAEKNCGYILQTSDGEDVVAPMLEQVATAVLTIVLVK